MTDAGSPDPGPPKLGVFEKPPYVGGSRPRQPPKLGTVRWSDKLNRLAIWTGGGWSFVTRGVLDAVIHDLKPPGDYIGNPIPGGVRAHVQNLSKDPQWRRAAAQQYYHYVPKLFGTKSEAVDFEAFAWSLWVEADRDVRELDDVITAARFWAIVNGRRPPHIRYGFAQYTS